MRILKHYTKKILDIFLYPFSYLAAKWFRFVVEKGIFFFPVTERVFMKVGVYPVYDHYYFPMINPKKYLKKSLQQDRALPGVNFNTPAQLTLLEKFTYAEELLRFPMDPIPGQRSFYYNNDMFDKGDAEILYSIIRYYKPGRIIEIGSGRSTLMALNAISRNKEQSPGYTCKISCIEPYEEPWLEQLGIDIIRKRVEEVEMTVFSGLEENDILFIDSSHMIRPQGDVLFEFLEVLPQLKPGVIVHVHDIFSPKDYPEQWVLKSHCFWNEQYLLEAFLSMNDKYEVLLMLNFLFHHHRSSLERACPVLAKHPQLEPRSIWLRRI